MNNELLRTLLPPDFDSLSRDGKFIALKRARVALLERKLALNSLWAFNTRVLGADPSKVRILQDPMVREFIEAQSAHIVQWLKDRAHDRALPPGSTTPRRCIGRRNAILLPPRRTGKSSNVSETLGPFVHAWDPEISIGLSAATKELVNKFADATKAHWRGDREGSRLVEMFGQYYPGTGNSVRPWNDIESVTLARKDLTRHDATLITGSVSTGFTGGHPDLFILDDPITEEKLREQRVAWMDKVWTHYKSLGPVINPDGYFLLVCTRYGEDDLVGRIIRTEIEPVVRERVLLGAPRGELPADFRENWHSYAHLAGWHVIQRSCEYDTEGNPVDSFFPIAWPPHDIASEKLRSPIFAAAQLNNRPADYEGNPVTDAHIRAALITKSEVPQEAYSFLTMHGDWAFKGETGAARGDANALFVAAHWRGNVYIVRGWTSRTATMAECADKIVDFINWAWYTPKFPGDPAHARIRTITYDADTGHHGSSQTTTQFFKNYCHENQVRLPNVIPIVRRKGQGDRARLHQVTGFWQEPRIFLVEGTPGVHEACSQMQTINSSAFIDEATALSDVFHEEIYRPQARSTSRPERVSHTMIGKITDIDEGDLVSHPEYPWMAGSLIDPDLESGFHPAAISIQPKKG